MAPDPVAPEPRLSRQRIDPRSVVPAATVAGALGLLLVFGAPADETPWHLGWLCLWVATLAGAVGAGIQLGRCGNERGAGGA